LTELAESIAGCMHAHDVLSPVGCHFQEAGGLPEVIVFASRTEVLGGPCDGKRLPSRFTLDVGTLLRLFMSVEAIEWQALPHDERDELGANLAIVGVYRGVRICVRVPAAAPHRFEPGRIADVYERRFINVW
jgi:hypothetical protein